MAEVREHKDIFTGLSTDGRDVVVKKVHNVVEIYFMRRCAGHRNIVTLFGVGEMDGFSTIIMERVEQDLETFRVERSASDIYHYGPIVLNDMLQALSHLESLNVMHYDVKPRNILCQRVSSDDGGGDETVRFKLCDFGISAVARDYMFTRAEQAYTTCYRPPELLAVESKSVYRFIPYSSTGDVWALALSILHWYSGSRICGEINCDSLGSLGHLLMIIHAGIEVRSYTETAGGEYVRAVVWGGQSLGFSFNARTLLSRVVMRLPLSSVPLNVDRIDDHVIACLSDMFQLDPRKRATASMLVSGESVTSTSTSTSASPDGRMISSKPKAFRYDPVELKEEVAEALTQMKYTLPMIGVETRGDAKSKKMFESLTHMLANELCGYPNYDVVPRCHLDALESEVEKLLLSSSFDV